MTTGGSARPKSSPASLVFAWTMFGGVLGLAAWFVAGPLVWPGRPTSADLSRGEALIRSQYSNARTRVGRVSLARAASCVMRGSAELVDTGPGGSARQAGCVVTIDGHDAFTATCQAAR